MKNFYPGANSIALMAVCLSSLMFGLEISSVPVILPTLEKVLQGNFNDLQWIMNAYTIACTTVLMATGTLADRFGRKRVFIISVIVFGITSLICGLSQSVVLLIISRFFQGMGGGAMLISQIAILSHQFQGEKERVKAFGTWGVIFGIGLGFGPIIGGVIVGVSSWEWVFLIHAVLAVLVLTLIFNGVRESKDPEAKTLDVGGIITLSAAVFGLTYLIIQGSALGFYSIVTASTIAVSLACFLAFVAIERLTPYPMFDFSVLKIRNFSGALLGSMGMNFSYWPFMIYLPIYFQGGLNYNSVTAGLSLLAYTIPTLVVPPVSERLSARYRPGLIIPLGLFTIGLGFILMKIGSGAPDASWLTMLPGALLAGVGLGLTNTVVTNTTTGSVSSARAGMVSGIDMSARLISLAINIAVMGFILISGVRYYLKSTLFLEEPHLRSVAEKIAAGNIPAIASLITQGDTPGSVARDALIHGFGWVLIYGAVSVWILAIFSFVTFRPGRKGSV